MRVKCPVKCTCGRHTRKGKTFEEIFGMDKARAIRSKISESAKERVPWNKGLTVKTDVRVAKCSQNSSRFKGKHFTEEQRAKLSETHKGKHFSDEHREKISKAQMGRYFPDECRAKMSEAKKLNIHDQLVLKDCTKLEKEGYRCILLLRRTPRPDIIAIKDSKVYAVEVERNQIQPKKYESVHSYDDIIWIVHRRKKGKQKNG